MEELWNLSFHVIQCVDFYATFLPSELGPPKHLQTQVNGSRVKSIDLPTEFENVGCTFTLSFIHQKVSILFKNMIISLLVGFCQDTSKLGTEW